MLKVAKSVINASRITGVLPVINGGTGVTTSTGTGNTVLSATPTLSGDVTLSTGNLVIGTSGKGIDFSADPSAPGMTSELLDDYEEGTWTPVFADADTGGNEATIGTTLATYTKNGNIVVCELYALNINTTGLTAINTIYLRNLPFAVGGAASDYTFAPRTQSITFSDTLLGAVAPSYVRFADQGNGGYSFLTVAAFTSGSADVFATIVYKT